MGRRQRAQSERKELVAPVLAVIALVAVGIVWRRCDFELDSDSEPVKPPPGPLPSWHFTDARPSADAAENAERASDAPIAEPSDPATIALMLASAQWVLRGISLDGTSALLETSGTRTPLRYRVISIATGAVEADVELLELEDLGVPKRPGIARDLARAREILKRFPLGAGGGIASSPDG
ncbi:MAG: hypothetical protein H0T42_09040, partial [Deltaproteobacteria bacterium]|nr:hypothetical protein [Deltaproteobacteria bacterium]